MLDALEDLGAVPRVRWLVVAVIVLVAAVAPLFRQTRIPAWQTLWAEDGFIYGHDAARVGLFEPLFRGYAGYLQLAPRVLAIPARWLPVRSWPLYFAVAATAVVALAAWFCYWATDEWISSRPVRLGLAALVVLMPAMGRENTATITNVIWALAAVAPWALVSRREGTRDVVVRATMAFFAATATPLAAAFAPVAVGWCVVRRTRAAYVVSIAYAVGLVLQIGVVLQTSNAQKAVNVIGDLVRLLGARVFSIFLLGTQGTSALGDVSDTLIWFVVPLITCVFLAVLMWRAPRASLTLALVFLVEAVVFFVVPVWGRGTQSLGLASQVLDAPATRFSVVPVFLLASAFALLVAADPTRPPRLVERVGRPLFVAQVVITIVLCFPVVNQRSRGGTWTRQVARAYQTQCVGEPPDHEATVKPSLYPWWGFRLPCRLLAP
jgi:hypothetical protein